MFIENDLINEAEDMRFFSSDVGFNENLNDIFNRDEDDLNSKNQNNSKMFNNYELNLNNKY